MAIRGILFDKDGTLIDVSATWVPVYHDLLAEMFPGEPQRTRRMMLDAGYDEETQSFRSGSVLGGGTTRELVEMWWPDLDPLAQEAKLQSIEHGYKDLTAKYLAPLMPLDPILAPLAQAGYRLGIGTNDASHSALSHMEALGAAQWFEAFLGWDSVERPKPAGDVIRRFASLTGLESGEIAMVGDGPHDMAAARDGGAGLAIAVLTGGATPEAISPLADYTIASVADLGALLARF